MKILLDLQGCQTESRFRGIGRQTLSLARALIARRRDHDIHVLLNRRLNEGLDELLRTFSQLLGSSNVHVFQVPGAVAEREPGNLWRTFAAEHVREAFIAEIAPDVVHIAALFEGYVDDAVTSIGRFDASHATAVTLHDLIPLSDPGRYLAEEGPRRHWLRRAQFLKRADLLLSVSAYSASEATARLHIPAERIEVISAGVDPSFAPLELSVDASTVLRGQYDLNEPFIFYVGAVDPRKNIEMIFAGVARLPEEMRNSHLIAFAGRLFDEEIAHLKILAARHGVSADRLRFLQQVAEADLIALYGLCAAFVFPSHNEGFGLPVLEAMACGAPTLAARSTSLIEVVANDAHMFDPTDPSSLASGLERILCGGTGRQEAIDFGLSRAASFTWEAVADRTLDALERLHTKKLRAKVPAKSTLLRKPKLAFLSPLPSDRSGIADYSAALLPELARFYEVECVVSSETQVTDEWILANYAIRDLGFFERNASDYDRVIYSVGNSHFHAHMLGLIRRFPGVVLLHDFFLSDLIEWMAASGAASPEEYHRELYRTHGLSGLLLERREGRKAAVEQLPTNSIVFDSAIGVIAHSHYVVERARELFGSHTADEITVIPHLKAVPAYDRDAERRGARARLGVGEDDLLVCSFGLITSRKRSSDILSAWDACDAQRRPGARLVFVGGNAGGEYGEVLSSRTGDRSDVVITGYAPDELYRDYLAAADMAVQLRSESRGESSGTILDCLAAGVPVIVNAHGPSAELPEDWIYALPDSCTREEVAAAIDRLASENVFAKAQADRGRAGVLARHQPALIGEAFRDAIEAYATGRAWREKTTLAALGDFLSPVYPDRDDLRRLSTVLAVEKRRPGMRQILYDITVLAESDAKTGIQRVVRSILINLIDNPPEGYRVEPVRMDGHQFRYARSYVTENLDLPTWVMPESPVGFDEGDLYLSIDWVPDRLPNVEDWLRDFRRAGGRVVIGVHDLLPFTLPQYFPDFMPAVTQRWFESALRISDQFLCVSQTVADDVVRFGKALMPEWRKGHVRVDYFHNAADLDGSIPSKGRPADAETVLAKMRKQRTFLMVGTIEPRKRHEQVLAAFQQLWRDGYDVALMIVGKRGWMMDGLVDALETHVESGRRLFWLSGVSDEFLDELYAASSALIAASAGEGFGLPLIEAALHNRPLIARGIPVFREVAGEHAFYFEGSAPQDLADALKQWLLLDEQGRAPHTSGMHYQTWRKSTDQIAERLFASHSYARI